MPWWGWVVLGILLFCVEMFAIDAQFYLVFLGVGAILAGLFGLTGLGEPVWVEWLLFAVISLVSMVAFRRRLYDKLRGNLADMSDGYLGERLTIGDALEPGAECRTDYRGSRWTAVNVGETAIPSGGTAVIESRDGLILKVRQA